MFPILFLKNRHAIVRFDWFKGDSDNDTLITLYIGHVVNVCLIQNQLVFNWGL